MAQTTNYDAMLEDWQKFRETKDKGEIFTYLKKLISLISDRKQINPDFPKKYYKILLKDLKNKNDWMSGAGNHCPNYPSFRLSLAIHELIDCVVSMLNEQQLSDVQKQRINRYSL